MSKQGKQKLSPNKASKKNKIQRRHAIVMETTIRCDL